MPYLNCPSCGLTLAMSKPEAEIEHCPRCLAKTRRAVGLFVSAEPRGRKPIAVGTSARPGDGDAGRLPAAAQARVG